MDAERRREIIKKFREWLVLQNFQDSVMEVPAEDFIIDLTEKATAEEIFKAIEEEYKMGLVPVKGLDYWESFKKKFGIGSEKDGIRKVNGSTTGKSKTVIPEYQKSRPSERLDAEEENPSPNKGVLEILKENRELNRKVRTMGTEILQHLDSIELMLKGVEDSYAEGLKDGDNGRAWRKDAEWKKAVERVLSNDRFGNCTEYRERIFKEMGVQ